MVKNSTNINKTNKHLSSQLKKPRHMILEIQIQAWYSHKYVAELNRLIDGYAYIPVEPVMTHLIVCYRLTIDCCFKISA
jgi:hypothetical protein